MTALLPAKSARRVSAAVRFGKVHFSCPACLEKTVLSTSFCGKPVACPWCSTGIRVPAPEKRMAAQNLERTMLPLIRPEAFVAVRDARKNRRRILIGTGALMLAAGLAPLVPMALRRLGPMAGDFPRADSPEVSKKPTPHPRQLRAEAEEVVRNFLLAPTPAQKSVWVVDPAAAAPLMPEWYARNPGGAARAAVEIAGISQGFSDQPGPPIPVSEVGVVFGDLTSWTCLVEHRPEGARIAWQQSVGYSPVAWKTMVAAKKAPAEPVTLRVLACRDDYFSNHFNQESVFSCIRLHDPQTRELLGFGYVPRSRPMIPALREILPPPESGALEAVTVTVRPLPDSASTHQVELVGAVLSGWQERNHLLNGGEMAASGKADLPVVWQGR